MNLKTKSSGSVLLIAVDEPRIDALVAIQFKDRFRALSAGPEARIIVDLSLVEFIDSSGLGAIVASMKQLSEGQTMELACLSKNVDKVFRLTHMDTVFRLHDTLADALEGSAFGF